LIFLFSCDVGNPIENVSISNLLHDNSSKVWVVDQEFEDGVEKTKQNQNFKTAFAFFDDYTFTEQPINTIGNRPPTYGEYALIEGRPVIEFKVKNSKNQFVIISSSKEQIILKSVEKPIIKLVLIPFPKLF